MHTREKSFYSTNCNIMMIPNIPRSGKVEKVEVETPDVYVLFGKHFSADMHKCSVKSNRLCLYLVLLPFLIFLIWILDFG